MSLNADDLQTLNEDNQMMANLNQTIEEAVEARLKEVHTVIPAQVVSFDGNTVSAQPNIQRLMLNGVGFVNLPVLVKVPVVWPGGGGMFLTFPIAAGDECLLLFSERAVDAWYQNGGVQIPTDYRLHDLSDAFALVGINNMTKFLTNVQTNAAELRTRDRSTYINMAAGQITIKGNLKVIGNVETTGNTQVDGNLAVEGSGSVTNDLTAQGTSVHTHTHSGVTTGGGNTGVPN